MAHKRLENTLMIQTGVSDCFDVGTRFSNIHPLGYGGNGLVFSAIDKTNNEKVAIKKIGFNDRKSCQYALREIKILLKFDHENIVKIHELLGQNGENLHVHNTNNNPDLKSVYLIQELLTTDLHRILQHEVLHQDHIRLFMYQILRGLKYVHSANVIHRDLKPLNLLVNLEDMVVKIADFGLSRVLDPYYSHKGFLTENVGTCWYRAPESILTPKNYSSAVDIWGAGCIFAEMVQGQPLFTGAHEFDQICQVLDVIELTDQDWTNVLNVVPNKVLKNHPLAARSSIRQKLPKVDSQVIDLIEGLLCFDPSSRLTVSAALSHPYMQPYHEPGDEPTIAQPFHIEDEVDDIPALSLRKMICCQALKKNTHTPNNTQPPTDDRFQLRHYTASDGSEWEEIENAKNMYNSQENLNKLSHSQENLKNMYNSQESLKSLNTSNENIKNASNRNVNQFTSNEGRPQENLDSSFEVIELSDVELMENLRNMALSENNDKNTSNDDGKMKQQKYLSKEDLTQLECEKDIMELSMEKLAEEEEISHNASAVTADDDDNIMAEIIDACLENVEIANNGDVIDNENDADGQSSSVFNQLTIEITENKNLNRNSVEQNQLSPRSKELMEQHNREVAMREKQQTRNSPSSLDSPRALELNAPPDGNNKNSQGATRARKSSGSSIDSDGLTEKERYLLQLEDEEINKCQNDKQQSEKVVRNYDELYRLPTDHLHNRRNSNEMGKLRMMKKPKRSKMNEDANEKIRLELASPLYRDPNFHSSLHGHQLPLVSRFPGIDNFHDNSNYGYTSYTTNQQMNNQDNNQRSHIGGACGGNGEKSPPMKNSPRNYDIKDNEQN
ncbi:unnamed protein product [Owenia fusiformis]|uniref:Uncharacterized protein n=1 Tax=Owenia fusiformis TaxID=6347 RepID=A0A8J1U1L3_OWEFU|nr:unnamed protein product [Owenia fusiformis]